MASIFEKYFEPIKDYKVIDPETGHQLQNSKLFFWCQMCLKVCIKEDGSKGEIANLYGGLPHAVETFIRKYKLATRHLK